MYECKMIAHSMSEREKRICTMQITLPMIVWNEMLTHRVFSRGSASSRAIPVAKMIQMVKNDTFIPDKWFQNAKGMQPGDEITDPILISRCIDSWLTARDAAIRSTEYLSETQGVAKEIANRLLMPFMWNTAIITSTEWCNFFNLRCHPMAQRQIRIIAEMMRDCLFGSTPTIIDTGDWHLPYIDEPQDGDHSCFYEDLSKISIGRSCRVSYVNQEGIRNPDDDIKLYERLVAQIPKHSGALEHVAQAIDNPYQWSGNFQGWKQYRKTVPFENMSAYTHEGITIMDLPLILNEKEVVTEVYGEYA